MGVWPVADLEHRDVTRVSEDEVWLRVAETVALRGTCLRRKVGAVLVDADGFVLSTGYNGRAAGLPHCDAIADARDTIGESAYSDAPMPLPGGAVEIRHTLYHPFACPGARSPSGSDLDACEAIHAEANALLRCPDVRRIAACYVTVSPCVACTKLLLNTSCARIVFREKYVHVDSRRLWTGRTWVKLCQNGSELRTDS